MLIDTHCHLHDQEWFTAEQQEDFLAQAKADGVEKVICIGTNPEDSLNARAFAATHAGVYWTFGIHPEFASTDWMTSELQKKFKDSMGTAPSPVAIGEIGLDYHYEGYDRTKQIKLFEQMLQLALDHQLPVSLHIREAFVDAWAVLKNFPGVTGVVHSFTGSKKDLAKALEHGFLVGVNGLVTYTTTPIPPLERILLETDAPFLTPVPFRGTINSPRYVKVIADFLAQKLGVAESVIVEQTTQNARQIFQI